MQKQKIFLIIFIVIAGTTTWIWFRYSNLGTPPGIDSSRKQEISETLAKFKRLEEVHLDTSILEDSFFKTLELPPEISPAAEAEKIGRENPFVPFVISKP